MCFVRYLIALQLDTNTKSHKCYDLTASNWKLQY